MTVGTARKRTEWSIDPDEVPDYSDWKITLAKKGDPSASSQTEEKETPSSTVTFSVHRNMLGPQSEYFTRIFKSSDSIVSNNDSFASSVSAFSESRNQHSHIDFPSNISDTAFGLIVEAFEALLDYCYHENVDLKGTSPVPLLYLCDYFQMKDDFESKVEDYSEEHFNEMANGPMFYLLYEEILEFRTVGLNADRAQTIISAICYDKNNLLSKGTPLAIIADLSLFLNVVSLIQERGYEYQLRKTSKCWSMNIVNFLESNDSSSAVDSDSFQKLTREEILPYIDANAALVLLKEEQKYASLEVHINDDDKDGKEAGSPLLTNLQNRCVESLVEARLELSFNHELRERATMVMSLLPRVMGMYLNKTLHLYGEEQAKLKNVEQELAAMNERYELLAERVVHAGCTDLLDES